MEVEKGEKVENMEKVEKVEEVEKVENPQTYSSRDRSYWHAPGMIRPSSGLDHQGTSRNLSTPDTLAWSTFPRGHPGIARRRTPSPGPGLQRTWKGDAKSKDSQREN